MGFLLWASIRYLIRLEVLMVNMLTYGNYLNKMFFRLCFLLFLSLSPVCGTLDAGLFFSPSKARFRFFIFKLIAIGDTKSLLLAFLPWRKIVSTRGSRWSMGNVTALQSLTFRVHCLLWVTSTNLFRILDQQIICNKQIFICLSWILFYFNSKQFEAIVSSHDNVEEIQGIIWARNNEFYLDWTVFSAWIFLLWSESTFYIQKIYLLLVICVTGPNLC